jgi:hypothetical protein
MVAIQTLKGYTLMHAENVPEWVNSSARIRRKFLSSMESLAHHEIGFNLVVFAILAFL